MPCNNRFQELAEVIAAEVEKLGGKFYTISKSRFSPQCMIADFMTSMLHAELNDFKTSAPNTFFDSFS